MGADFRGNDAETIRLRIACRWLQGKAIGEYRFGLSKAAHLKLANRAKDLEAACKRKKVFGRSLDSSRFEQGCPRNETCSTKIESRRPDLISKQLVAINCGELFLIAQEGFTASCDNRIKSSDGSQKSNG